MPTIARQRLTIEPPWPLENGLTIILGYLRRTCTPAVFLHTMLLTVHGPFNCFGTMLLPNFRLLPEFGADQLVDQALQRLKCDVVDPSRVKGGNKIVLSAQL